MQVEHRRAVVHTERDRITAKVLISLSNRHNLVLKTYITYYSSLPELIDVQHYYQYV